MHVQLVLACVAGLLLSACLAIPWARRPLATTAVYLASLLLCTAALGVAFAHLWSGSSALSSVRLPLGLPWLGANFRIDALSGFFLVVVNLGAAIASLYSLGYGRSEPSPHRVLPFFPRRFWRA